MDIYSFCDEILSSVFDDYFHGMPEFAEDEEPEQYAVYTVSERPGAYASGRPRARQYRIAVSVFSGSADTALYSAVESAFTSRGAVFSGGEDAGSDTLYPVKKHYSMDFLVNQDV